MLSWRRAIVFGERQLQKVLLVCGVLLLSLCTVCDLSLPSLVCGVLCIMSNHNPSLLGSYCCLTAHFIVHYLSKEDVHEYVELWSWRVLGRGEVLVCQKEERQRRNINRHNVREEVTENVCSV